MIIHIPMIKLRKSEERGSAKYSWLDTKYSFSFNTYYDPKYSGFSKLRVINEDIVAPGKGFPKHPHDNMEIITYVLSGELAHQDSMGNGSTIQAGDFQLMSAGSGIEHSEYNASATEPVHLYQIWIETNQENAKPTYQEKKSTGITDNKQLVASPDGTDGSMKIRQDAKVYIYKSEKDQIINLDQNRKYWLQMIKGNAEVNSEILEAGDGIAISNEDSIKIVCHTEASYLWFDLPAC